jgi:hypothetical protein
MNKRIEEIKQGYECYKNKYPLNPPQSTAEEALWNKIKNIANGFELSAPQHVGYLLNKLEKYEQKLIKYRRGLEEIAGYISDDAEFMRETAQDILSQEALKEE